MVAGCTLATTFMKVALIQVLRVRKHRIKQARARAPRFRRLQEADAKTEAIAKVGLQTAMMFGE